MNRLLAIATVVFAALPIHADAQGATPVPVSHNQIISTNPFGATYKWWNVEYEQKVSEAFTVAASGSALQQEGGFQRATLVARFYPQRAALTGVYIGGRAGVMAGSLSGRDRDEHATFAGVEIGRNWLVGPERNVSFGIGLGFDRVFAESRSFPCPGVRLINVGIAF
jgi:hypothetical protein